MLLSRFFTVPFLLVFTLPMAVFAGITTTFACSLLMFRVTLVYIDLLFQVFQYYVGSRFMLAFFWFANPAPSLMTDLQPKSPHESLFHASPSQSVPPAYGASARRRSGSSRYMEYALDQPASRYGSRSTVQSRSQPPSPSAYNRSGPPSASTSPVILGHRGHRRNLSSIGLTSSSYFPWRPHYPVQADINSNSDVSGSLLGCSPTVGLARDYEGVGGWNMTGNTTPVPPDVTTTVSSSASVSPMMGPCAPHHATLLSTPKFRQPLRRAASYGYVHCNGTIRRDHLTSPSLTYLPSSISGI